MIAKAQEIRKQMDIAVLSFLLFVIAIAGPLVCVTWALAVWVCITILKAVGVSC